MAAYIDKFDCVICGQESLTDDDMKTHMLVFHMENTVSCPMCDLCGITADEMTIHINSVHLDDVSVHSPLKLSTCDSKALELSKSTKLKSSDESHDSALKSREKVSQRKDEVVTIETDEDDNFVNITMTDDGCIEIDDEMERKSKEDKLNIGCHGNNQDHVGNKESEIKKTTHNSGECDDLVAECNVSVAVCPVCGLEDIKENQLAAHVEEHFVCVEYDEHHLGDEILQNTVTNTQQKDQDCIARQDHIENEMQPSLDCQDDSMLCQFLQEEQKSEEQQLKDQMLAYQLQDEEAQLQERREREEFKRLQARYGMDNKGSFRHQSERNLEKAVWNGEMDVASFHDYKRKMKISQNLGVDDGKSRTKGIIEKLTAYYSASRRPYGVHYAKLCVPTDHFAASYGDKGWGCGYRNVQMLLSAMLQDPQYSDKVFNKRDNIPSIPKLQQLIEAAWSKGFDVEGSQQLGGQVCNTRKWIGASEIVTMLSSLFVRCRLIDFHRPTADDGTHPELFTWIKRYFDEGSHQGVIQTNKTPLYLQHEGHSRTIVGYEQMKDSSIRLLLFDPGQSTKTMRILLTSSITSQMMRSLRKPLAYVRSRQYQIVSVDGLLTDTDYQRSKVLQSQRIP
ncbi:zinc finger-containing ubiquitin peptidase 1-like [Glandiceps talaboti]